MHMKKFMSRVWKKIIAKNTEVCIIHRNGANVRNCQREGAKGQDYSLRRGCRDTLRA